jgi:hypothetical protein
MRRTAQIKIAAVLLVASTLIALIGAIMVRGRFQHGWPSDAPIALDEARTAAQMDMLLNWGLRAACVLVILGILWVTAGLVFRISRPASR